MVSAGVDMERHNSPIGEFEHWGEPESPPLFVFSEHSSARPKAHSRFAQHPAPT
jgi:hypothetical protein